MEMADAIAEMRNYIPPKDYHKLNYQHMKIYLVEAGAELLGAPSARFSRITRAYLQKIGVKNRLFVFINRVRHYFTCHPSLRLIIKPTHRQRMRTSFGNAALLLLLLSLASACGHQPNDKDANTHGRENTTAPAASGKWQTDSATRLHVLNLHKIVSADDPQAADACQELSENISAEINALLRDCRMKGDAHEALHQWLESFMESNAQLKQSGAAEEAARQVSSMRQQLDQYTKTFE